MSNRWPGGLIRKTPVTPAGPFQNGAAPGMWTLAEASYWTKQGLWPIAGNEQLVVEDVFSTYLYTGNSATQTITNGIDLAGKGGLVWIKNRTTSAYDHYVVDTVTGNLSYALATNATRGKTFDFTPYSYVSSLNSNGFSLAVGAGDKNDVNASGQNYVSWTFREAPNFFDVVTYTGNGANRTIAHNLGVAPGMIIVKRTDSADAWYVYHRSLGGTKTLALNTTDPEGASVTIWNDTNPTSSVFTVGTNNGVNASGGTYVAYLFAHNTASDGIIQCGSYTGNGSATGPVVTLGWEPQWVLIKNAGASSDWYLFDNMRGMPVGANDLFLRPNLSSIEAGTGNFIDPTATGFNIMSASSAFNTNGTTYIYMAIRRGPMRTPTLGTSVFSPVANSNAIDASTPVSLVPPASDLWLSSNLSNAAPYWQTRLMGWAWLRSSSTSAEDTSYTWTQRTQSDLLPSGGWWTAVSQVNYFFRRAPSFMDVVCYTGTGVVRTVTHNLGVVPTLTIIKRRDTTSDWRVTTDFTGFQYLNDSAAFAPNAEFWGYGTPTSTTIPLGTNASINASGGTYVAYLFASAPGVSKVGSYTGNGSSQTINCAFTTGARFVMIKRTDSTGDWYVWDSARGIVAGNDPYLALNSSAAQVTSNDSVDTDSTGFVVNQVAASNINVNAATYIFLAIA